MAHEVIMPALGMAQDTGLIVSWLKNEGDEISVGDAIMEVETDKATMEVEAEASGFLTNVRAAAGDDVPVGDVVAYISESADEVVEGGAKPEATAAKEQAAPADETPKAQAEAPKPEPAPAKHANVSPTDVGDKILASPKARKLAYEEGLDITQLAAKGVPQPYHVKDLEQLRGAQGVSASTAASGPQTFHIGASVPRKKVEAFKDWLKTDHQTEIENGLIWLGFATSAFRAAFEATDYDVCVLSSEAGGYVSYVNADRRKLVEIAPSESDVAPDFILRDLTETAINMVQTSAAVCPTLTIARSKKAFVVSLAYQSDQLSDDQAIQFVAEFTARLNEPLRHLL